MIGVACRDDATIALYVPSPEAPAASDYYLGFGPGLQWFAMESIPQGTNHEKGHPRAAVAIGGIENLTDSTSDRCHALIITINKKRRGGCRMWYIYIHSNIYTVLVASARRRATDGVFQFERARHFLNQKKKKIWQNNHS